MKIMNALLGCAVGALVILECGGAAQASPIYADNFDNYSAGSAGTQYQTGDTVYAFGSLPGWTSQGNNGAHAVNLGGGNIAMQLYDGGGGATQDVLNLTTGIAANSVGTSYVVNYTASPTVWQNGGQVTSASDGLLFEVLDANNTVIATHDFLPGAWTGSQIFTADSFTYTGDGDGGVKIEITGLIANDGRFGGAVDNLSVSAVPVPASFALFGLGLIGIGRLRRKAV